MFVGRNRRYIRFITRPIGNLDGYHNIKLILEWQGRPNRSIVVSRTYRRRGNGLSADSSIGTTSRRSADDGLGSTSHYFRFSFLFFSGFKNLCMACTANASQASLLHSRYNDVNKSSNHNCFHGQMEKTEFWCPPSSLSTNCSKRGWCILFYYYHSFTQGESSPPIISVLRRTWCGVVRWWQVSFSHLSSFQRNRAMETVRYVANYSWI